MKYFLNQKQEFFYQVNHSTMKIVNVHQTQERSPYIQTNQNQYC